MAYLEMIGFDFLPVWRSLPSPLLPFQKHLFDGLWEVGRGELLLMDREVTNAKTRMRYGESGKDKKLKKTPLAACISKALKRR